MAKGKSKKKTAYGFFMSGMDVDGAPVAEPSISQVAKGASADTQYIMNVATREKWLQTREKIHTDLQLRPVNADLAIEEQHELYRQKRREFLQKEDAFLEDAQRRFQEQVALGTQEVRGFRDYMVISARRDRILVDLSGEEKAASDKWAAMMVNLGIFINTDDKPPQKIEVIDVPSQP